jgi:hypothetical protein
MSRGTHVSHCCKTHGCKYGDPTCPVVGGLAGQRYPCEQCADTDTDTDIGYRVFIRTPNGGKHDVTDIMKKYHYDRVLFDEHESDLIARDVAQIEDHLRELFKQDDAKNLLKGAVTLDSLIGQRDHTDDIDHHFMD